jgi:predicted nucleic acid-binding Zn ribbon protein
MSAWKNKIAKKYDEHRHCSVCGISIPPDKEYCSIECGDKYKGYEKKKSRNNYIQIAVLFGVMIIFFLFSGILQG